MESSGELEPTRLIFDDDVGNEAHGQPTDQVVMMTQEDLRAVLHEAALARVTPTREGTPGKLYASWFSSSHADEQRKGSTAERSCACREYKVSSSLC